MGKRLSQLNEIENKNLTQDDYLLVDGEGYLESKKVKLKNINISNFDTNDFYTREQSDEVFVGKEKGKDLSTNDFTDEYKLKIDNSQEKLVDGKNVKTINGQSILGAGNLELQGTGGSDVDLSNYYTKEEIDDKFDNIEDVLDIIIAEQESIIAIQNALIGGKSV